MVCVAAGRQQTESQVQGLGKRLRNASGSLCNVQESARFRREGEALSSVCLDWFGIAIEIIFLMTQMSIAFKDAIVISNIIWFPQQFQKTVSTSRKSDAAEIPFHRGQHQHNS